MTRGKVHTECISWASWWVHGGHSDTCPPYSPPFHSAACPPASPLTYFPLSACLRLLSLPLLPLISCPPIPAPPPPSSADLAAALPLFSSSSASSPAGLSTLPSLSSLLPLPLLQPGHLPPQRPRIRLRSHLSGRQAHGGRAPPPHPHPSCC